MRAHLLSWPCRWQREATWIDTGGHPSILTVKLTGQFKGSKTTLNDGLR
jgi:hypothetical protein